MATNKKFRIQNGANIVGELSINDVTVITETGEVVAGSIQSGVQSIVDQNYVNLLNVSAQDAVTAQSVTDISAFSTTDVSEGSNLYYTDARVRNAVQGGDGVSYDQSTGEFSVALTGGMGISVSGSTVSLDGENIEGDLIPTVSDVHSLGSPDKVWKDLYIGPGSLYINGTKILEDNSGTITMYADPGQNLSFGVTAGGSIDMNAGTESIQMKSDVVMSADQTISTVGGVPTKFGGEIDMQGEKVINVATPTGDADAATKAYVDSRVGEGTVGGDKTFSDNVVVQGDLTVQGTTTTVNSETISLADNIIDVNSNVTSGFPTENAGLRVMRGDEPAAQMRWNEGDDHWEVYDGSSWTKVALETDDLTEGSSNLYFTDARAKSAVAGDISSAVAAEALLRSDADAAEASARAAADSDLQDDIDGEIARAQGVEAGLDSDISVNAQAIADERSRAMAAEGANSNAINNERDRAVTAETMLQSAIDGLQANLYMEIQPIQSDHSDLEFKVFGSEANGDPEFPTSQLGGGTPTLWGIVSDNTTAIGGLMSSKADESDLASEVASRQSEDSALQAQINTISDAVDAIVGTSPESLNTLQEIVAAFGSADGDLQEDITANTATIGTHTSDIASLQVQVSSLQNDVGGHQGDISVIQPIVSDHTAEISALNTFTGIGTPLGTAAASLAAAINEIHNELNDVVSDLNDETIRAGDTENGLDSDISALQLALAAEVSARQSGDSSLDSSMDARFDDEARIRSGAIGVLQDNINTEEAARMAADSALDSDLGVEIAARIAGDSGLQTQINALTQGVSDEGDARDSDVSDLQAQINNILSNTDQTAIDSLTEVVTAFQNADNSLGAMITANQITLGEHGSDIGIIKAWTTDDLPEGDINLYFTEERARGCVGADVGSCIDYNASTGKFSLDVSEVEVAVTPDNAKDADKLDGQHGSHYRIDISDINGNVVN